MVCWAEINKGKMSEIESKASLFITMQIQFVLKINDINIHIYFFNKNKFRDFKRNSIFAAIK